MRDYRTLFCSSKLPWPPDRISLKFIDILGMRAEKLWPVLLKSVVVVTGILYINARNMFFPRLCAYGSHMTIKINSTTVTRRSKSSGM